MNNLVQTEYHTTKPKQIGTQRNQKGRPGPEAGTTPLDLVASALVAFRFLHLHHAVRGHTAELAAGQGGALGARQPVHARRVAVASGQHRVCDCSGRGVGLPGRCERLAALSHPGGELCGKPVLDLRVPSPVDPVPGRRARKHVKPVRSFRCLTLDPLSASRRPPPEQHAQAPSAVPAPAPAPLPAGEAPEQSRGTAGA